MIEEEYIKRIVDERTEATDVILRWMCLLLVVGFSGLVIWLISRTY